MAEFVDIEQMLLEEIASIEAGFAMVDTDLLKEVVQFIRNQDRVIEKMLNNNHEN